MFNKEQKKQVEHYLSQTVGRIYIGCDSVCYRRYNKQNKTYQQWARYAVVLVVHIDNSKGCKIFHYTDHERNFDADKNKPRLRLMSEVYKSVECYFEFSELLAARDVEIHIDINPDKCHASNAVAKQALGYVKGTTNIDALIKPDAWAGSNSADYVARQKMVGGKKAV